MGGPGRATGPRHCRSDADCAAATGDGGGARPRGGVSCHWLYDGCQTGRCMCDPRRHLQTLDGRCIPRKISSSSLVDSVNCRMTKGTRHRWQLERGRRWLSMHEFLITDPFLRPISILVFCSRSSYISWRDCVTFILALEIILIVITVTSCRRVAATICPAPVLPLGAEAPCAAEQTAT